MSNILENELFEAFATTSDNVYIYVCDVKSDLSRWSPNAVEYFNLPGEYICGAGEMWGERVHPEDREAYFEDITAVFTGKSDKHSCQYRALNRYGEYIWLECKGRMLADENGELSVFAGLMTRLDNQNKYDSLTGMSTIYDFYSYDFNLKKGYMLLIGIDEFRKIVSNYGYSFGDRVLVEFSKNLRDICTHDMKLYRMNGDEFLIIIPDVDHDTAKRVFDSVRIMAKNLELEGGRRVTLSVSAGAVEYPQDGSVKEELLNNLEHSLEYRKSTRRGSIAFFSTKIAEKHIRIQTLKDDLKNSIDNGFKGFELYFQPLVDSTSSKIIGCESLLRWKGEKIIDSYPSEFIKILEDDGNIIQVGKWVMEEALKHQSIWQKKYGDIQVSFNVSYQQFIEDDFADILISKTNEYGVKPHNMIVELTESCHVEESDELAAIFHRLMDEGFQVALDDFGTAYSSLEMLKMLPATFIKIEHSFVRELAEPGHEIDYIIIENMLSLCRRINCKSIVEGVENKEVDGIIKHMDSTYLQGYYYSKPICRSEFEKLLDEQHRNS